MHQSQVPGLAGIAHNALPDPLAGFKEGEGKVVRKGKEERGK